MSVYTTVTENELKQFLSNYSLGELKNYQGISDGIENTNYFVTTSEGSFVLTLFEVLTIKELPFYVELMAFLNEHKTPSAYPIKDDQQHYLRELNGKPAILMQRLPGTSIVEPSLHHCGIIGSALAELHQQGQSFKMSHENFRGAQWRNETGKQLMPMLPELEAKLLENELRDYAQYNFSSLPRGIIHADLFRDNVLFDHDTLTGILDFYNACNDTLLYDLAITVNDWCISGEGNLDFERAYILCHAYQSIRKPTPDELELWPVILRIAAMRFWLSRMWCHYHPKGGELTFLKDPEEFKNILLARTHEGVRLREIW